MFCIELQVNLYISYLWIISHVAMLAQSAEAVEYTGYFSA